MHEAVAPVSPVPRIRSEALAPDRSAFQLTWSNVSNVSYQVELSRDLATWSNASPGLTATSSVAWWLDNGTDAEPAAEARVFHRVRAGD